MILLDGIKTSQELRTEIATEVNNIVQNGGKRPHLAAVLVGNNGASVTYVNAKIKACEEVGFTSTLIKLSDTISESELLLEVEKLNSDPEIDGFIVQLPLPLQIDEKKIILSIRPEKDVDGFHPENVGRMALGMPCFIPATPAGIIELLDRYNIETGGKHCVVLGRSHIVGQPISLLMARNTYPGNSTVTLCHSHTRHLSEIVRTADILIAAVGRPNFVTADMVKEGVVVIDVGITRVVDKTKKSGYRIVGDVDFDSVSQKAAFITPVPGGVGPMTIVSLLKNTLKAARGKKA
ncbi:bifunctional 5,10-methylenetetrahydrofolate dehydrogenase/5,10-methenyltetrahydrofolate cyclohydrolase [Schleiferia thermophila]|jgi:methylenetetrahydrofolate dehydrogenase (NADP+)/methenyltetrahydrofolate cyclohydrolase|uniref:Bifunctional protein FolD n=1 Tax=Schleiferia thermophila TaxID=884107 RepID=A0A369AD25_9FLAO|nr:tetrahydrofolate dehydrogenase/cyclohydrolase catalytic domain-containing protein [Schleiferia thermophila]KFD39921.1 5,10-methylene-tetrahydrofolate dehydrogenase [Schleiferia thermophila str. Yellowstone]PMB24783.1 bifunctional 5,10-methylene-tetrahydrofolate dehydrogenase/5,10-methylene-tetrahydrofolate cyclohydrolase [Fischerella thermalis CCMEE 5319]RCX05324.1 methylenetetrahydrofolate dehydrogenase (NADP+)/methenyltetrahydrofolate cyclohydrolase [Schleiferia thermophila]GCD79168.1 bifu